MKLNKGVIIAYEDENLLMNKSTYYEIENNLYNLIKENKQLKEDKKKAKKYIDEQQDYFNNYPLVNRKYLLEILGDKENE